MHIALSEAKGQLSELARRAQQGEEVVLTRHGVPYVRLAPVVAVKTPEERRAALQAVMDEATRRGLKLRTSAARSQDFLYDETGMPG